MKKLYVYLTLTMFMSNYMMAESVFSTLGRAYNGDNNAVVTPSSQPMNVSDVRDLRRQLKNISKDISKLDVRKKEVVKTKVSKLADIVNSNQVFDNKRIKRSGSY